MAVTIVLQYLLFEVVDLAVCLTLSRIDAELVGLCLVYGMNLNGSLFVVAWMYCQLENKMVSVERIQQYSDLPAEAELSIVKTRPSESWPYPGTIVMNNLKVCVRSSLALNLEFGASLLRVLEGFSF
jgi:ATP-binding cassette subfamily C (CFTR/MRP) protein 2